MARSNEAPTRKTGVAGWNESEGIASRGTASAGARHKKSVIDRRRRIGALAALCALCVACLVCMWPPAEQIKRGLWLGGGTATTMDVVTQDGATPSASDLSRAASVIRARLRTTGVDEYDVRVQGDSQIVIQLPDDVDADTLAKLAGGKGKIEFVQRDEIGDADALAVLNAGGSDVHLQDGTYTAFIDDESIESCEVTNLATDVYAVNVQLDEAGAKTYADVTGELAEDYGTIAVVMDGNVVTTISVFEQTNDGSVSIYGDSISGYLTREEANALKAVIDGDELPFELRAGTNDEVGALAGHTTLVAIVVLAVGALVGATVAAFSKFRKLGLVVSGALVVYGIVVMGIMGLASRQDMFELTIPGVVGGFAAAALVMYATWRMCASFQRKILDGGTFKGSALSCVEDGIAPLGWPCLIVFGVALAAQLIPPAAPREFCLLVVFGMIAGVIAVLWFGVTTLRLLAVGAVQANPIAWGVARKDADEDK